MQSPVTRSTGALSCVVVASFVLAACGGGGDGGFGGAGDGVPDAGHAAHPADAGHDATSAASHLDAASLLPPDTGVVPHDAGVGADAGHDVAVPPQDSGRDAGHDAVEPIDAGHDAMEPVDAGHDAPSVPDAGYDSSVPIDAIVYGHSATTLYAVNPNTDVVTAVGDFAGCGSEVIDIALDKYSNMYATSTSGVYTVDTTTAACHRIALGNYPNSLSFVPAGTLDPTAEALVGYNGATYVQIDTTSGALTTVGQLGGDSYTSSGDIVSVIGGGTYLTVTGGSDCSDNDCLVEVNPTTGALITNYGSVKHPMVYGLAFWAGNVYGFDSAGQLFQVAFPAGGGLTITDIPIPNAPHGLSFYGAGSTTSAPNGRP